MNKITSARIIVKKNGDCDDIDCKECFTTPENCGCRKLVTVSWTERKIKHAKAYIKRHEGKCKKKDKVEKEIKPAKVTETKVESILNMITNTTTSRAVEDYIKSVKPKLTPLEVAKAIRDNGYSCMLDSFECSDCPLHSLLNPLYGEYECVDKRGNLIDDYISANELTVKENLSVPQPIKFDLPKIAFVVSGEGICVRSKNFTIDENGYLLYNGHKCYDNVDKAVAIFKASEKA